jgi:hypothetical protein
LADKQEEAAMLESLERRKSSRLYHRSTILLTDELTVQYSYAQLNNISGDGMYIGTEYRFKPGTEIDIRFDKPPFRSAAKQYHAIVKWCRALVGNELVGFYGVGVKYL